MSLKKSALILTSLVLMSTNVFAGQTSFKSKITKSEDCSSGFDSCKKQRDGLGTRCEVLVNVTNNSGGLSSKQYSNGSHSMKASNVPKIINGKIILNNKIYTISYGMKSDAYTIGGNFSAFMGDSMGNNVGARVFFTRSKNGIPKAYAAFIYKGNEVFLCGKLRPSK